MPNNFFAELKRRNVHKVAIAYGVVAWLLVQVAFLPAFEAPSWAIKALIVLLALGFTVVGPGVQLPVTTKGITESFGWSAKQPILPNSIVAGRYFEKTVQKGGLSVDCFAREDHLEAIQKSAGVLAQILDYYTKTFGPPSSGEKCSLVEVDDKLSGHHGTMGTVFVTHRELSQEAPATRQLARRAAYQWWMETVGLESTDDLWLADGMAYYSAALYLGQSGGPSAFQEELNSLAVLALKFESKSAVRSGLGLGYRTEAYESVVAGKGGWVVHMLHQLLHARHRRHLLRAHVMRISSIVVECRGPVDGTCSEDHGT